jgi:hypothetical protein
MKGATLSFIDVAQMVEANPRLKNHSHKDCLAYVHSYHAICLIKPI